MTADLLHRLGSASLPMLWLPLAAWTAVALLMLAWLRVARPNPFVRSALDTALFWALPLGLVLATATDFALPVRWNANIPLSPILTAELAAVSTDSAVSDTPPLTWHHVLGVATLLAALLAACRLIRLALGAFALARLHRTLSAANSTPTQRLADDLAFKLGIRRPVRAVTTAEATVPLTFGWRRPVIVVPENLLDEPAALRLALLHELVHVRRHDYVRHWTERVVGAVFAVHPLVGWLRGRLEEDRELLCDAILTAQPEVSRQQYAALLFRFATSSQLHPTLTLRMSDTHHHLKQRFLAMNPPNNSAPYSTKRATILLAVLLLTGTTMFVACSDIVGEEQATSTEIQAQQMTADGEVYAVVEEMPQLVGGLEAIQQDLRYPELAKKAGIEGRVIVQFVIDKEGHVLNPKVVKGVGGGLDEEALRAVSRTTFVPGRQNGEAVAVKMSLPVTFKLDSEHRTAPDPE